MTFAQRLGRAAAARRPLHGRERARRHARRVLRHASRWCWRSCTTSARCCARSVMNGISSALKVRAVHAGPGLRRRAHQLRSARYAGGGQRQEAGASRSIGPRSGHGERLALPDRRPRRRFARVTVGRRASPISGTRRRSQFAHVSGLLVVTPDGTAVALFLRRGVLAEGASPGAGRFRRGHGWHRSSTSCCSTASSTTRRTGRYGAVVHEHRAARRRC